MYINNIKSPQDVKRLTTDQLCVLADEIRQALLAKLSVHGGHVGPNLGMVEATIALHYVFDSPHDKIVYDVSHQSYVHKILTGRAEAFLNPDDYDVVSGYTNHKESEHDFFTVGHTSTSVSLACGLAKARDLEGRQNNVIAVIGDGSLSGGEAFEGLSNTAEAGTNMIIVVNDNEMSIAENHGGLYQNLQLLRESGGQAACNYFRALGLDYIYVEKGNDLPTLITAFKQVKDSTHPIVVHIHTQKGKGFAPAERDKERFHWSMPFDLMTGAPKVVDNEEDYGELTGEFLIDQMNKDPKVIAITSGTPAVFGFSPERRKKAGRQFVDVGIAEEHAVTFSGGLAKEGLIPFCNIYSSFMQRAFDEVIHDVAIQNLPVVFCLDRAGLVGEDGMTHHGAFDLAYMRCIPNMTIASPIDEHYLRHLMFTAQSAGRCFTIRYPRGRGSVINWCCPMQQIEIGKGRQLSEGSDIAVLSIGPIGKMVQKAIKSVKTEGVSVAHYDMIFLKPIDTEILHRVGQQFKRIITVEDGTIEGGLGSAVMEFMAENNYTPQIKRIGIPDRFIEQGSISELYTLCGMDEASIVKMLLDK